MAKQSKGPVKKETEYPKKPAEPEKNEAGLREPQPVEKIKVNRSRRRLYETPKKEGAPVMKHSVKAASKGKKATGRTNHGAKKTAQQGVSVDESTAVTSADAGTEQQSPNKLLKKSSRIVEKYSAFASGSVLLPIPGIDIVYITGIQLKMLSELSKLYKIEFKRDRGKAIVTSLISGIFANRFMFSAAPFMVRYIPVVGFLMAPLSIVLFSSAVTYSVGRVFIQHFESGGTFLNFKPDEVRTFFRKEFEKKYQLIKYDS